MTYRITRKFGRWRTEEYDYQKSKYHCLNCGSLEVYSDVEQTEFYEGRQHVCLQCDHTFFVPIEPEASDEAKDFASQIREQLGSD